jgi:hypothetical protein
LRVGVCGVGGKGSRLPLDEGGEVVHALCAGGELRSHVLALAGQVTRRGSSWKVSDMRYALQGKGEARFRQGSGCCWLVAARNRCCFADAFPRWLEQRAWDRQLRGMQLGEEA